MDLSMRMSGAQTGRSGLPLGMEPEALTLFARMTVQPSVQRKLLISRLIGSLKGADVWGDLDALYVLAAHDAQAAQLNWIADEYNLTPVNAPAFEADLGYTGDGSTSQLDTGFNPATAVAPKFTQNDAHMGIWSRTNLNNAGGISWDMGNVTSLFRRAIADNVAVRPNTNSSPAGAGGEYPGHNVWARSASDVWERYKNGVDNGGGTDASVAPDNSNFLLLGASSTTFGVNQIGAAHFGSNLTEGKAAALYGALNTYMAGLPSFFL